jgi:NAD(P)-dependent dehydrogenase (short-subunit alcohol dehydrogenase family)
MPSPDDPADDHRRVVVIAGATGSLGRVVAATFAADGHRLVLVGRDAGRLDGLAAELGLVAADWAPVAADLREASGGEAIARTAQERFGRIDMLLHLVGGYAGGVPLVELEPETLTTMLDQHVWSTFHVVHAVVPPMVERGWGRVVAAVASATTSPPPKLGAYVTAKAAQEAMLRVLAREVAASGVTVNVLAVKAIDAAHARETEPSPKNASWTTPEEISAAMRSVCSDAGATINGARIPLDGRG